VVQRSRSTTIAAEAATTTSEGWGEPLILNPAGPVRGHQPIIDSVSGGAGR
jgi:hypothetical protein